MHHRTYAKLHRTEQHHCFSSLHLTVTPHHHAGPNPHLALLYFTATPHNQTGLHHGITVTNLTSTKTQFTLPVREYNSPHLTIALQKTNPPYLYANTHHANIPRHEIYSKSPYQYAITKHLTVPALDTITHHRRTTKEKIT